jgi:hypothetical protein
MADLLRRPALKSEIEAAITSQVKQSDPACEKFAGAIITDGEPKGEGAGWTLRGVKYGGAPRAKCDAALAKIMPTMQGQYLVLNPTRPPGSAMSSRRRT